MSLHRRNLLSDLHQATGNHDVAVQQLALSDEEAFGLSKFCRWNATAIAEKPATPADAAAMLQVEAEPRFASLHAVAGPMQVSHLLISDAVVRQLLLLTAEPAAPMFSACRRFVQEHRDQLAACSGLHLTVLYLPADLQGHAVNPIHPPTSCSMPT